MSHPKLTLKEFRDLGFLQELNRRVLHAAGLAMAFGWDEGRDPDQDEPDHVQVYDYRDDPEGILFGPASDAAESIERLTKLQRVEAAIADKADARRTLMGDVIQPVASLTQIMAKPENTAA